MDDLEANGASVDEIDRLDSLSELRYTDRQLLQLALAEIRDLNVKLTESTSKVNVLVDGVMPHLEEIGRMVEQIQHHPMAKMLGVKSNLKGKE